MDKQQMKLWLDKQFAGFKLEEKTMFGNPYWLVNGNMFANIEKDQVVLKLAAADVGPMIKAFDSKVKGYIMAFNGMLSKDKVAFGAGLDEAALKPWFQKAYDTAKALPPKVKK